MSLDEPAGGRLRHKLALLPQTRLFMIGCAEAVDVDSSEFETIATHCGEVVQECPCSDPALARLGR